MTKAVNFCIYTGVFFLFFFLVFLVFFSKMSHKEKKEKHDFDQTGADEQSVYQKEANAG